MGYILGVVDTSRISVMQPSLGRLDTPLGVTAGQLQAIIVKYLEANPQKRHYSAADLVYIALRVSFPNGAQ